MKVYGATRNRETAMCRYKCCGGSLSKTMRRTAEGRAAAHARRKTERDRAKREIASQTWAESEDSATNNFLTAETS